MCVCATPATKNEGRCQKVPHLPRKAKVDVAKCHACRANGGGYHGAKREPSASPEPAQCRKCHTKRRSMSPSATPATQRRSMSPSATSATRTEAATTAPNGNQARLQSQPSAVSATPATPSDGRCRQGPRLPRKSQGRCHQVSKLWVSCV